MEFTERKSPYVLFDSSILISVVEDGDVSLTKLFAWLHG